MKFTTGMAALVVACSLCCPCAQSEPPTLFDGCRWWMPSLCKEWRQRHCWCPDNYNPKAMPPIPCAPLKGCADDYHAKPMPCVPVPSRGCVDDYCPKQCPIALPRTCEPWYTCGPCSCRTPAR